MTIHQYDTKFGDIYGFPAFSRGYRPANFTYIGICWDGVAQTIVNR